MKKIISFRYYMNLQAKYLIFLNHKTNISIATLAGLFAVSLHDRLHHKYIIRGN